MNMVNRVFLSAVLPFAGSSFPEFEGFREEEQVGNANCSRETLLFPFFDLLFSIPVGDPQEFLLSLPSIRSDVSSGQGIP